MSDTVSEKRDYKIEDLTEEGEDSLVACAKEGSSAAFAVLSEKYYPLIKKTAYIVDVPSSEREDLMQEGLIGLMRAVRTYDCKSSAFSTYAAHCIKNAVISALRKYSKNSSVILVDTDFDLFFENGENPESVYLEAESAKSFYEETFGILSKTERAVFEMYLSGFSYKSTARILHKNVKSVDNAVQRIKAKIKKKLGSENR